MSNSSLKPNTEPDSNPAFTLQGILKGFEESILPAASRPVILIAVSLLSYCAAVSVLRRKGIDCLSLLKIKARYTALILIGLALFAYGIASTVFYFLLLQVYNDSKKYNVKMWVMLFNFAFGICLLVLPSQLGLCWWERKNFMLAFWEIVVGRSDRPGVPFRLVLLADIFTSYAKVGQDYFDLIDPVSLKKSLWFLALKGLLNSLPLVFRLRQCLWEWKRNRSPRHLVNSLKYFMGIVVGILSKAQNPVPKDGQPSTISLPLKFLLFGIFAFSTLLSLGWDLIMDWNISFTGFRTYAPTTTPLQSAASLASTVAAAPEGQQEAEEAAEESQSINSDEPLIQPVGENSAAVESSDQEAGPKKPDGKMGRFSVLFYAYVILFNALGRFLTLLRGLCYFNNVHEKIGAYLGQNTTSLLALVEAYRRFNWMLLRVENYHSQVVYVEGTNK